MTEQRRVRGCEDLFVWQRSIALVKAAYRVTRWFPPDERFGLTSQIRRAAVSVPANIAEGHARLHRGDFVHHLSFARSSLAELKTHCTIAIELGFVERREMGALLELCDHVGRMLTRLQLRLPRPATGETRTRYARRDTPV